MRSRCTKYTPTWPTRSPRKRQRKKMNIQKPVLEVPESRNVAPNTIPPAKQHDTNRHCRGSCHQSIEKRRNEGRRSACWPPPEMEYATVPNDNPIMPSRVMVQKIASGLLCASLSGAISEYPVQTERPSSAMLRTPQMVMDLTRTRSATPSESEAELV